MQYPSIEHGLMYTAEPKNEALKQYAPGSPERSEIAAELRRMSGERLELPLWIGGRTVNTGRLAQAVMPHAHAHVLADAHLAGSEEIDAAVEAACLASVSWSRFHWSERAAIFLKAAELLSGPWRMRLNAATMLGQSKTVHQAEIDAAAELIDFWRFNVNYMQRIYADQPLSTQGVWNRVDYRPLEGFVFAITPFNFTAIAGNLPTAPALMGNTVVWKPASTAMYSAHLIMELLREAGLPDGVINLINGSGAQIGARVMQDRRLAGVHFTGSTRVFNGIADTVGKHAGSYNSYPRVVGETGGKNFILAHTSADENQLATAVLRGGFEYQGQKCSAASRIFVPESSWPGLQQQLCEKISTMRMGDVADFGNFMGAVIDEAAWTKHRQAIAAARNCPASKILAGGASCKDIGYFVEPTLIQTDDLQSPLLHEELFGPIVTAYVYPDSQYLQIAETIDKGSAYALTGAVFARDRNAISQAMNTLRFAAGNFYINDKPTGAVVGQQPFGGARASGTNDKAGSMWNLMRWASPRSIKETFSGPNDYRYPFMAPV